MHFSIKICKFIISQKPIFTSISVCHSNSLHSEFFPSFSASVSWFVRLSSCSVTLSPLPPPSKQQTPMKETCLVPKGQLSGIITIRELEVEKADQIRPCVSFFSPLLFALFFCTLYFSHYYRIKEERHRKLKSAGKTMWTKKKSARKK